MKPHPVLGIMVRSDGMVLVPANYRQKEHWTYGAKDSDGYCKVCINYKTYSVHRLVAETFIPNPENKPVVDHIKREEKSNNDESNLRWATVRENALNKKNNLVEGKRRGDISEKEYKAMLNSRWLEKNPDYYKSEEYKQKRKIQRAKCV